MAGAMHIGEVAARTDLSLRTLRHYDEIGLLRPSGRTDGGFRLYTEAEVERLLVIRRMKPLGFSLEEMARVMEALEALHPGEGTAHATMTTAAARERLGEVLGQARERREKLRRQLDMADEFIGLLREQG